MSAGVVLRYFNVCGERQSPDGAYASVIPLFKKALIDGAPITIFGDGNQVRDFISVHEVVEANLVTAVSVQDDFLLCNIATGESINLHRLLLNLENETGKKATNITFKPKREGEIKYSRASVEKWKRIKKEFYDTKENDMSLCLTTKSISSQKDV